MTFKEFSRNDLKFTRYQIGGHGGIEIEEYAIQIVRGGMPALIHETPEIAQEAMIDYVENIAYIDMRTLPAPPTPERIAALIRSFPAISRPALGVVSRLRRVRIKAAAL